ncbi:hypothetical protein F2P56_032899 [Juglans regia]|uniref:Uncharacterized protein n=1 Tax=Juglans regia TaxID=51240 RepID=A0A833WX44_JUGRE|nr:hypothetical protein F2P56_032899 [Juglans regia]
MNFARFIKEFLSHAEAEVRSLASLYSSMGRNAGGKDGDDGNSNRNKYGNNGGNISGEGGGRDGGQEQGGGDGGAGGGRVTLGEHAKGSEGGSQGREDLRIGGRQVLGAREGGAVSLVDVVRRLQGAPFSQRPVPRHGLNRVLRQNVHHDSVLVSLPAPTVSLRPPLATSAGTIAKFFHNRPDNAFEVALAGTSYSFLQRLGAVVIMLLSCKDAITNEVPKAFLGDTMK